MMESALKSLMKNVKIVLDAPGNYDARAEIFLICSLACNGILSIGEKGSGWPMHGIEHALSAYYDITHGIGLAIITPRWMNHILNEQTLGRFVRYGINVMGVDPKLPRHTIAKQAIADTYSFFESLGIPMHLKEVGIDESRLSEMAHHIAENEGLDSKQVYAPLTEADILTILRNSL